MGIYVNRDDIVERLLIEELRLVNKHLPTQRTSLEELLKMEYPHVVLRDGTLHFFRKRELEFLARVLEKEKHRELMLPIIIVMRPDIGEGVGVVEDPIAAKVLSKILDISYRVPLYLYKPQLAILREMFDTVIQFAIRVDIAEGEGLDIERSEVFL